MYYTVRRFHEVSVASSGLVCNCMRLQVGPELSWVSSLSIGLEEQVDSRRTPRASASSHRCFSHPIEPPPIVSHRVHSSIAIIEQEQHGVALLRRSPIKHSSHRDRLEGDLSLSIDWSRARPGRTKTCFQDLCSCKQPKDDAWSPPLTLLQGYSMSCHRWSGTALLVVSSQAALVSRTTKEPQTTSLT